MDQNTPSSSQQLNYPLDYVSRSIIEEVIRNILVNNLIIGKYTSTQRDQLPALQSQIIFNTTTSKLNFYTGSAWEAVTSA